MRDSNSHPSTGTVTTDLIFRYDCGFTVTGKIPSLATFSRFFTMVSNLDALSPLFANLVKQATKLQLISGDIVAIDASAIKAYEKTIPRKNVINDGNYANWGAKLDTNGNQHTWFGYKLHLAVDTASELPLAVTVTPASQTM